MTQEILLMNTVTRSVDTADNWMMDYAEDNESGITSWEQWSKNLVEVTMCNGEPVEISEI